MTGPLTDEVVMRAREITKVYGATHALKGVDFDIRPGTVTVLFGGENGGRQINTHEDPEWRRNTHQRFARIGR